MYITQLAISNFRNLTDVSELVLAPRGLLIAAAPNATGKTNFLESVVMLLRGKSFRASHAECIGWGGDSFIVRGEVHTNNQDVSVAVRYHEPTKRLRVEESGIPASPVTFYQHYPLVLFLPEDTFLFTRGPAQRRNFLNRSLVSTPAYVSALVQYQRSLRQRNANVRSAKAYEDVAAWTDVLVEHADTLWTHRHSLIDFMATHLAELYTSITAEELKLTVTLSTSCDSSSQLRETLREHFEQERRHGYTMFGPHRDDITVMIGDRPVGVSLSQGQQRSLVIALKLAVHRYITQTTGEVPLLVCDELLSELDSKRQEILLAHLPTTAQIIIATTEVPSSVQGRTDAHFLDLSSIIKPDAATASSNLIPEPVAVGATG